jgi:hypothetical protein
MITPFQFKRIPAQTTTVFDPTWDTLIEVGVPVGQVGHVYVDFRATIQVQYTEASSTFLGATVRLLFDDEVLVDNAFIDFDPAFGPPNIDTYAGVVPLQSLIENVAPGPHKLEVQWSCNAEHESATIFPGSATLLIEGKS